MHTGTRKNPFILVAPYKKLVGIATRVAAEEGYGLDIHEGVLDQAAKDIEKIAPDYEVIISRGGTADYIRAAVEKPVVFITVTATDLLSALLPFAGSVKKVLFFNYHKRLYGVPLIAQVLQMQIEECIFTTRADIEMHMLRARSHQIELIVGGTLAVEAAQKHGLPGVLVELREDSILQALREAASVMEARRALQEDHARLHTILSIITEGVLVTNESNQVTILNPAAQKLLQCDAQAALGNPAQDVIPNTRTHEVLKSGKAELGQFMDTGNTMIVSNRVPIIVAGQCVGVVCTFVEVSQIQKIEQQVRQRLYAKGFTTRYQFADILTMDPGMQKVIMLARKYAQTEATVLIQGESGTGKELFAQSIHQASRRAHGPFVALNCAAIPETLLESELFGYEEGAFTGARRQGKAGFFELAHQGTLFLDEIGELPPLVQARLLRVLQERQIVRVGGSEVIPVDVRIICATNRDLAALSQQNIFRRDLYYRLNTLQLTLPALRTRPDDILFLATHFLRTHGLPADKEALLRGSIGTQLKSHTWPGNIRELQNVMERLTLITSIMPEKPWQEILNDALLHRDFTVPQNNLALQVPLLDNLKDMLTLCEKQIIEHYSEQYQHNQGKVAEALGISRMSVWRKLQDT